MTPELGADDATQYLHQRAFAGTVFADQPDDLTGRDGKADIPKARTPG